MQKKTLKSEQGSITLFVLLAILFFLIVIFSVFMTSSNKNRTQLEELDKIKQEYEKDLENIDEIYKDITKDSIFIVFRTPDGKLHPESRWTNQDLTVKIYYPEGTAEENKLVKIDNGEYTNYTGEFTINKSTKITAMIRNGKEKEANAKIDKTPPTYTTNPSIPNFPIPANSSVADISISVNASDAESGLKKLEYAYVEDTSTPTSYTELSNDEVLTFKSKPQGVYYLWLRIEDNVGNITNERVEMNVVDYVAKIGDTYYVTLQDAIDACPEGTLTQIDIIKPIEFKPNAVVPNGKNVTINLNGYSITGPGTIIENNGTLTIIDTNTANTGKITSTDGTVIQNNGTFTLGANDGIVNQTSPVLTGENMVINTSGTFNFYDGVLIGDKAIEGTINSQPDEYSVISKKDGDKERVYLGVLAESAARIDKWFYNTLDEAIADCPENAGEEKTTITILRDLSLTTKATIDNGKNVIIDLNGHSITNTISDYVIENSSTLEILDSTETKVGSINGVNYSTVLNNRGANLTVSSGTISLSKQGVSSSNYYSSVRNEGEFLLKDNGKIQTTQSSYTYGVYNNGSITTSGGNIANTNGIALYNTNDYYMDENTKDYKEFTSKDLVNNGTYYFEDDENGSIVSNNQAIASSKANSYIELDLTNQSGRYLLELNAEISSQKNSDYGYAVITETPDAPSSYYSASIRLFYISGEIEDKKYTYDLEGGKKYYLHLCYQKSNSTNEGDDRLKINSIKMTNYDESSGNLELNGVTIEGATGIYNNSYNTIMLNNVKINVSYSYNNTYGIYNKNVGIIDFNSGEINSSSSEEECHGIYNYSTGVINIKSGTITSKANAYAIAYGLYNNSTGTINIGEDDGIVSPSNPSITGVLNYNHQYSSGYGIYNKEGILNFYDGTITGNEFSEGNITQIPSDTEIKFLSETDSITGFLTNYAGPVAEINGVTYNTLQDAFDAVRDNQENATTVKLLRDIIILNEENRPIVNENKNIYLDLNGHTITANNPSGIDNKGTLEIGNKVSFPNISIKDLVANGTYYFEDDGTGSYISNNAGKSGTTAHSYVKIDLTNYVGKYKVKVNCQISSYQLSYGYATITESETAPSYNNSEGRFMYISGTSSNVTNAKDYSTILTGGKVYYLHLGYRKYSSREEGEDRLKINAISLEPFAEIYSYNQNAITNYGNLKISNKITILGIRENTGIENKAYLELNDITISVSYGYALNNNENGIVDINTAYIESSSSGINNANHGIININNMNLYVYNSRDNSKCGIYNNDNGIININNGLINVISNSYGISYGIYNKGEGDINISKALIKSFCGSSTTYGVYNSTNGNINMTGGEIITTGSSPSAIFNNADGIINIQKGKITSTTASSSSSSTGIYSRNGNVTIGINDETVSQEDPIIEALSNYSAAKTTAISVLSPGKLNFYDGKITGKTSINATIGEIAPGCDIIKSTNGDFETSTLDNSPVAQIANTTYQTLQEAFDAVEDNKEEQTVIKLLRDTTILNEEKTPIINSNKNIIFDLNGYEITSASESGLINNGTLTIENNNIIPTISLDNLQNNGTYYFINDGTGKLIANNTDTHPSVANSYLKIDLSDFHGTYKVTLNAEIISGNLDYGYATITETTSAPEYSSTEGQFMKISGKIEAKDYTTEIKGGKVYYLHLGYRKYNSGETENDQLTINSINIESLGRITSQKGSSVTNWGQLIINDNVNLNSSNGNKGTIFNGGKLEITGGDIISTSSSADACVIYNESSTAMNIYNGNIYLSSSAWECSGINNINDATININGGTVSAQTTKIFAAGILNNSIGIININGGTISGIVNYTSNASNVSPYGIYNSNENGIININDGKILSSTICSNATGIYNNGKLNINKGKIETNMLSSYECANSYGIYNTATGILTIGINNDILDNKNISILATSNVSEFCYGVYNQDGIFNFYDGKLSGNFATNGLITSIPNNTSIKLESSNDIETATLDSISPVAQINENTYMTLQDAFDAIEEDKKEPTTITLLRNILITEESVPTIQENKNILLNMNRHKIISGKDNTIINNGTLEIIDSNPSPNISLSDVIANGEYFFEEKEDGTLVSNNQGIDSSIANSYIKIDLTNYVGSYELTLEAEISSYSGNSSYAEYGYATITESENVPSYSDENGQFMKISGTNQGMFSTKLEGGKIYFLHLGYRKTTASDTGSDQLKIKDLQISTSSEISNINSSCISNYGILKISDNITMNIFKDSKDNKIIKSTIYNEGELVLNDGFINSVGNTYGGTIYSIYNNLNGTIIMNNGTINSSYANNYGYAYAIYNNSTREILINDGKILALTKATKSLEASGSTYGIYNISNGNIIINSAKINASIYTRTFTSNAYGIYNEGNCIVNNGFIYTYIYSSGTSNGIYNGGNLTINDITIKATSSTSDSATTNGIYNYYGGNAIIRNGIITASGGRNYSVHGIYNYSSNATCTLGNNDGIVNVNYPKIETSKGTKSYGIYNASGTFNFYDGKITAGTATITGNVTEVAPGYEIKKTSTDEMTTDILVLSSTDNTVCVLNSINYATLQDALDACTGTENYTISLTNACRLTEPITIPSGKNITLSINGFDILYDGSDSMIVNNGTLTIKDTNTVSSGNLSNTSGNVIENNGTLIIGDNDGSVTSRSPHITGTDIAITNNETIEFYDGTITGITPISGNDIKTIPEDYNLVETTEDNLKTLSLVGIAPEVTYITENVSGGTKITVTATDTNLSMIINPDDSEITGTDTEIVSEYIATSSGVYTFKAIDKNNNVTTIDVAV